MGAVVHGLAIYLIPSYNMPALLMTVSMGLCIGTGVLVYAALAYITRSPELGSLLALIKRR